MSIKNGHARWAFDLKNWHCTLNNLELATACIQPEEKERISNFVFRDDFNASLIGRLLMRHFVKSCMPELDYNDIRFERDSRGKPYFQQSINDDPDSKINIDFNVSHHERYAVLAGIFTDKQHQEQQQQQESKRETIGVDVMKNEYDGGKPLNEFFRLMHRTFTPNEWQFIKSRNNALEQTSAFMRHWCLKESYVKSIGVGITFNLQSIDFQLNTDYLSMDRVICDTTVSVNKEHANHWIFEESLLDADHSIAVAIKHPSPHYFKLPCNEYRFEIINFDMLMRDSVPLIEIDSDYCRTVLAKKFKNKPNK